MDEKVVLIMNKIKYWDSKMLFKIGIAITALSCIYPMQAQQSVARQWNEVLLEAVRNDFARPTVHARNLFHTSVAMYDAWAVFDEKATTYLLGKKVGDYVNLFDGITITSDVKPAQEEAISYAAYRVLKHRFARSPGAEVSLPLMDSLMLALGYDADITSEDYTTGSPAALGNYIAKSIIEFGFLDHSNEIMDYANLFYLPYNDILIPTKPGSQGIEDPNRWQPLSFDFFIDQAGFEIKGGVPEFLSAEWGFVTPFSLSDENLAIHTRDGNEYWVYNDPGPPAYLEEDGGGTSSDYKWSHSLVAIWSSQLDPSDGVMIDISPASIGNLDIETFPTTLSGLRDFYKLEDGGDPGQGYDINPYTQEPYEPQIVPRGDYTRVLAEFWADGPNSETPPGHWFTILNAVNDYPELEKRFKGEGAILDDLEWDVKAYFTLGGAMHDAAIAAWAVKGWYDYVRPISAIRCMAEFGQSTDPNLPNYSLEGIPLQDGYIELVTEGDSLAGEQNEHLGKVKLLAWRGPEYIPDPDIDEAGVGWILAENWWPYQRPTFVTPPFAGYISGHSTYSRAGAEVLTLFTGDEYFPGGMGEFEAKKNEFLVFEEGPTVDLVLQWAKYYDASDQCSLSRIWGGIHPPVDDMPGRLIGRKVGMDAFYFAETYFGQSSTAQTEFDWSEKLVYPNPISQRQVLTVEVPTQTNGEITWAIIDIQGKTVLSGKEASYTQSFQINLDRIGNGLFLLKLNSNKRNHVIKLIVK